MELEATQSQLHTAKALLEAVEGQREALQASQDRISALLHPIRRAPDDILKMIFEHTVAGPSGTTSRLLRLKLKQAMALSAVCGRWRAVAIETPRLWNQVFINFLTPLKLEYHRDTILPRIKNAPCEFTLFALSRTMAPTFLAECGLANLASIECLSIAFPSREDIKPILSSIILPSTCAVGILQMGTSTFELRADLQDTSEIDILPLLSGMPSLNELRIVQVAGVAFRGISSAPNITRLVLSHIPRVLLPQMLAALANLEYLSIDHSNLQMDNPPFTFIVPSIRSAELLANEGESWTTHIASPNLESLGWDGEISDALLIFLSTHRTITTISFLHGENAIPAIESVAPQVRKLLTGLPVTSLFQSANSDSSISFPSLESISVYVCAEDTSFGIDEFESFIRARCLPAKHPKCLAKHPSNIIPNVSFISKPDQAQEWHKSELFRKSSRSFSPSDLFGRHLSWPEWS